MNGLLAAVFSFIVKERKARKEVSSMMCCSRWEMEV